MVTLKVECREGEKMQAAVERFLRPEFRGLSARVSWSSMFICSWGHENPATTIDCHWGTKSQWERKDAEFYGRPLPATTVFIGRFGEHFAPYLRERFACEVVGAEGK